VDDFPAAHSMDTVWFAVDAAGRVAMFDTGENGHAPKTDQGNDIRNELWQFHDPAFDPDEDYIDDEETQAAALGLYSYSYGDSGSADPIERYARLKIPEQPLHVDQLPPAMRRLVWLVVFEKVNFADAPYLQPIEVVKCVYWYSSRVAYVSADGITVRPIRGQEARFREFVDDLRRHWPDAPYHYEGID